MHGDRIARERIDDQDVEGARRPPFEREPPVAGHDFDPGGRAFEKCEFGRCQTDDERIDLVEDVEIAEPAIAGDGSRPETDDPYADRAVPLSVLEREAHPG